MRLAATATLLVVVLGLPLPAAPATPQDLLSAAVDDYGRGNLAEARGLLESLRNDPSFVGGRAAYLLGVVYLFQKQFPQAAFAFGQAEQTLPILADYAHYYQAVAAFDQGQFGPAAQGFEDILTQFPRSKLRGLALFWRAESLWGARSPDAPAAFHQYLEEFGQGRHAARAWFDMGQALEEQGKWEDAVHAYRRIRWGFETTPYVAPARQRLEALASAHRLPPDATPPEVFYRRALVEIDSGNPREARKLLQQVLGMKDGWRLADDALYNLGTLAYQARRFDEAAGFFHRDANLRQEHRDDALFWLARIALVRGREAEALEVTRRLIQESPRSSVAPHALFAIAEVRLDRGATGLALTLYRQAAEQFPGTRWGDQALLKVGWLQYQARQVQDARASWLSLVERSPDAEAAPAALYWAARAAEASDQSDLAEADYRRAATQYVHTYYGQRSAARLRVPVRIAIAPPPEVPAGVVPALDRYRELDRLAQIEDAIRELEAAAASAPMRHQEAVNLLLAQRYAQQDDVARSIETAEKAAAAAGGLRGRSLPLALWQALYPQPYWPAITQAASRVGVDPYLVAAVIREESRFDPHAGSPAGAYGLMQLVLGTARTAARRLRLAPPNLAALGDPATNIALGTFVLAGEIARFTRLDLALAAYNAGPGPVRHWQIQHPSLDPDAFVEEIPFIETRLYVKTVQQSAAVYRWLYRDGHPSPAQ